MGKLINPRLRSATLVDTIVALIIVLALTVITVTILVQITATGYSSRMAKADALLSHHISVLKASNTFSNDEFQEGELMVKKEVSYTERNRKLIQVKVSVYDLAENLIRTQSIICLTE